MSTATRAWEIRGPGGIHALALAERVLPDPGEGEVRVRVRAVALNYRDLSTVLDPEARRLAYPRVPCSDMAGEVEAVGDGVTRFAPGDRVVSSFFQRWVSGPIDAAAMASALGGPIDGVLAEHVVLHEEGLAAAPAHLDLDEAATLPCAALTAWRSLVDVARTGPGDTVLLLGTGGVSVFALQIAALRGARAIVTSSSDDKLERAAALGAWRGVNYREQPEWQREALELSGGAGVDHVVEVGGAGTLARSLEAVRVGGSIGLIGVLAGGTLDPTPVMRKSVRVQGIYVGPREMLERMCAEIERAALRPVIDSRFAFTDAREALEHMRGAAHFGKIVVQTNAP